MLHMLVSFYANWFLFERTVKVGYKERGYYEIKAVTNKQIVITNMLTVLTRNNVAFINEYGPV